MSSLLPAHRRAKEFAARVEGGGRRSAEPDRFTELLEVVDGLRAVESPEPRPEFVADLRTRLMAEAETALSETERSLRLPERTPRRHERRIALIAGTAALVGATTSVAVAAQGTLPGDTLYPVKRAVEGLHTTLTIDDGARAETVLDQATRRLSEVESLAREIDSDQADEVPSTLDDFSAKAEKGADLVLAEYAETGEVAPVNQLRAFVDSSMDRLVGLDSLLPSSVTTSLNNAATTLTTINDRILRACPECDGSVLEMPGRLLAAMETLDPGRQRENRTPRGQDPQDQPRIGGQAPLDPDQVIDLPDNLPTDLPDDPTQGQSGQQGTEQDPGQSRDDPLDDPVKKVTKPVEKTVNNTVKGLDKTLSTGNRALLGEDDGLLGPLLDPLLDPLLGKGGLLKD